MARKKKAKSKYRGLKRFLTIQLILILLVIAAVTYYYVGGYAKIVSRMQSNAIRNVSESFESTFRQVETSIAYDADGEVLSILKGDKDVYYLSYNDIPIYVKEAIISVEDKKFYDHEGVDYMAVIRAIWAMIRNGKVTQGASTITQQLARTIFLNQDKTWERKIEEIFTALELEKRYTKNQILEFYLNNIYFANGYYGIEAASRGYFNLPASELSLSQTAFLCAIPNRPSYYDPVDNMSNTMDRRNFILKNMYEDGIISLVEYQNALSEKIYLNMAKRERHNYQETYLMSCAIKALMRVDGFEFRDEFQTEADEAAYRVNYNEVYEDCSRRLYRGGYRIYTSLDSKMQEQLQEVVDTELATNEEVNEEGIYALQGSATCIDNETGFVKAIVGGRYQEYDGYTLNRAFQSWRQPGSAIKPLIVYTPALERDYTANSVVVDERIPDGPANSGGGYSGRITLRSAVERSKNTVAWKLFEEITPTVGLSYLKAMGFAGLEPTDAVPAAALGGFTRGTSSLEMAVGYSTLENLGYYREPTCITKITDSKGNFIYEPLMVRQAVYTEESAKAMTDILEGVFTAPGGTARGLGLTDMNCAGKTGTTNDNKDGWFVGYTPYYTTAVWVGFDTPRELPGLWGSTMPGHIWKNYMSIIHEELPNKEFKSQITTTDITPENQEQEEGAEIPLIPQLPPETTTDTTDNNANNVENTVDIPDYTLPEPETLNTNPNMFNPEDYVTEDGLPIEEGENHIIIPGGD